jgi:hypothetical protein
MKTFTNFTYENKQSIFNSTELPDKGTLFNRIKSLGSWLYKSNGLGLMKVIDDIFTEYKYESPLTQEQINRFNKGLEELKKTSMSISYINSQLSYKLSGGIQSKKLVLDDNGNWHPVNKLNTNYLDLADLLTELVIRGTERNYEKGKIIYDSIFKNPKDGLLSIKDFLKRLIIFYFIDNGNGIEDFKSFTKYSTKMSEIGEISENEIMKFLESREFTVTYVGGNGDFIDMIFGTDMIVFRNDYGYKSVQVKNRITDWSRISHYKVDWVAETTPITIYNLYDKTIVYL